MIFGICFFYNYYHSITKSTITADDAVITKGINLSAFDARWIYAVENNVV